MGRPTRCDLPEDDLHHAVGIGEHVIVPEPDHMPAVRFQASRADLVRVDLARMLAGVQLDCEVKRAAREVQDEAVDHQLTRETRADASQPVPQPTLGVLARRRPASQWARVAGPDLTRFVEAQADSYAAALAELRAGAKRSHWMWFVFPQIAGLGQSPTARFYAIRDRAEAEAYLAHPVLGPRLLNATAAMLGWAGRRSAEAILGGIDAVKLRSSCTLFEAAGGEPFARCLDELYGGDRDGRTLELLG